MTRGGLEGVSSASLGDYQFSSDLPPLVPVFSTALHSLSVRLLQNLGKVARIHDVRITLVGAADHLDQLVVAHLLAKLLCYVLQVGERYESVRVVVEQGKSLVQLSLGVLLAHLED